MVHLAVFQLHKCKFFQLFLENNYASNHYHAATNKFITFFYLFFNVLFCDIFHLHCTFFFLLDNFVYVLLYRMIQLKCLIMLIYTLSLVVVCLSHTSTFLQIKRLNTFTCACFTFCKTIATTYPAWLIGM